MIIDPAVLPDFTEVRPSATPGAGLGLFATKPIRRGTVWWRATPDNVIRVSRRQYDVLSRSHVAGSDLSRQLVKVIRIFGYCASDTDEVVIALDDGRFVNHSVDPNSTGVPGNPGESMAARDIAPGEEITEDYRTYSVTNWDSADQPFAVDQTLLSSAQPLWPA